MNNRVTVYNKTAIQNWQSEAAQIPGLITQQSSIIKSQRPMIDNLNEHLRSIRNDISRMQEILRTIRKITSALENDLISRQTDLTIIQEQIAQHELSLQNLRSESNALHNHKINDIQEKIKKCGKKNRILTEYVL